MLIKGRTVRKNRTGKLHFGTPSLSLFSYYITCHFSNGMQSCNLTSKLKENLTVSDVYRFIFVDTPTTHLIHVSSYIWATIFKNEAQVRVKLEQKSDEHLWTETTSFHWTRYLCIRSSNIPLSFSYQWLQIGDLPRHFKTLWMECCIIRISMQNILFIYASRDYQNCTWTPPFC